MIHRFTSASCKDGHQIVGYLPDGRAITSYFVTPIDLDTGKPPADSDGKPYAIVELRPGAIEVLENLDGRHESGDVSWPTRWIEGRFEVQYDDTAIAA